MLLLVSMNGKCFQLINVHFRARHKNLPVPDPGDLSSPGTTIIINFV